MAAQFAEWAWSWAAPLPVTAPRPNPPRGNAISILELNQASLHDSARGHSRRVTAALNLASPMAIHGRKRMARLTVNGKAHQVDVDPNTPLLWVIREQIGLTGTKYGCGIAQCGACTVHIEGIGAVRSCSLPVSAAEGMKITTIEGLAQNGVLTKVQKAWIDNDVPQCGYCQSGMIMAVAQLLKNKPKPTDADIDANITNICRCGTFQQVRAAIHAAAASA